MTLLWRCALLAKNATLGALETDMASTPELGIMAIFTAPTQAKANEAAKITQSAFASYAPNRKRADAYICFSLLAC